MRTFLVEGPRGEYLTRVSVTGSDEDEIDISNEILILFNNNDWPVSLSIEPWEDE